MVRTQFTHVAVPAVVTALLARSSLILGDFDLLEVDVKPPELSVLNLAPGMVVQRTVHAQVHATDNTGVAAVRVSVDGTTPIPLQLTNGDALSGTWEIDIGFAQEGSHTLVFTASDLNGFDGAATPQTDNPLSLTLDADSTPPIISITGVSDGGRYASTVSPTLFATDAHDFVVTGFLDGRRFASGSTVTDGDHALFVNASDVVGNVSTRLIRFTVDTVGPTLSLRGPTDNEDLAPPVTLEFSSSDLHPRSITSTLDGAPITSGTVVSELGQHVWTVTAIDTLGNMSSETRAFRVSKKLSVSITGVVDGDVVQGPVTPIISATGAASVDVTLNDVPFPLGDSISSEGTYVLTATATSGNGKKEVQTVTFAVDRTPPLVILEGPADGSYLSTAQQLRFSVNDQHLTRVNAMLDGLPFSSDGTVSAQGAHIWVVEAEDAAGNIARQTRHFTLDFTDPVITISGVTEALVTKDPVTIHVTVAEDNLAQLHITVDDVPFTSGDSVSSEGDHTLFVQAIDLAGHTVTRTLHFAIDLTPPTLSLGGVANGDFVNRTVTLTFSATDAHPGTVTATVDDAPISSGDTVSSEGAHTWVVSATDAVGNTASETRVFTLDFIPPAIAISGVTDGQITRFPVGPVVTISGATSSAVFLDGAPFVPGTTVSTEGPHAMEATATDAAGNLMDVIVRFEIDTTPPLLTLTGVADGASVRIPVTLTFSATDLHAVSISSVLDEVPFNSGDSVSTDGTHVWQVSATDAAGNTATQTRSFTIDTTPPGITVNGVTDGLLTRFNVTPEVSVNDGSLTELQLDGAPFVSGALITTEGHHVLSASAVDLAGNTATRSVSFDIDKTPPTLSLTGVLDGALITGPVSLTYSASDTHPGSTSSILDGSSIASGAVVSDDGPHTWIVTSTDAAGNTASQTRQFAIDATGPVITISGIANGESKAPPVTPEYLVSDPHLSTVSATLNGAPFSSGTPITTVGAYTLVVTATDTLGNSATRTVSFTLTPAGTECRSAELIAINTYSPDGTYDAVSSFSPSIQFKIPQAVAVIFGSADGMEATLSWTLGESTQTCRYRGGTSSYTFLSCDSSLQPGDAITASSAKLHLIDGSHQFSKTVGKVLLAEVSPCLGHKMVPPFRYTACASNGLNADGGVVGGALASDTDVTLSGTVTLNGDAVAGNNLTVTCHLPRVAGRLYYGNTVTNPCSTGTGATRVTPPPTPCACSYDFSARIADAEAANNNNLLLADPAIAPNIDGGALTISAGSITLPPGRFHFSSISISGDAGVQMTSGATTELFVAGDVSVLDQAQIATSTGGAEVLLVSGGNVTLSGTGPSYLQIYAPAGIASVSGRTSIFGAVVGNTVSLSGNAELRWAPGRQIWPPPMTCQ